MSMQNAAKAAARTVPVSFRLPAKYKQALADRGKELGLSPGEFARKVIIESLNDDFHTHVFEELARIFREVQTGRDDLATVAKALMVTAGHQSEEEVQAWINEALHAEG
jgi:hypothetical protein